MFSIIVPLPFWSKKDEYEIIFFHSFIHLSFCSFIHDDIMKWKHFPHYWPFVRGIHWSPVNSPHKGQWRGALMFSLICVWINGWANNGEAGDLRRYHAHFDVTVMWSVHPKCRNSATTGRIHFKLSLWDCPGPEMCNFLVICPSGVAHEPRHNYYTLWTP